MIELTLMQKWMLIRQVHQMMFVTRYFLNYSFQFQPNVSNRCHGLLMMSINLSDIATLNINGFYYCCIISLISQNEVINILQNADLTEKCQA